jgi:CRISPR-associated protein Csm2
MREKINSFQDLGKALGVENKPQQKKDYQNNYQKPFQNQFAPIQKVKPTYMEKGSDYVKIAEENMLSLRIDEKRGFGKLTTSKIRNILTLVNEIYNEVVLLQRSELPDDIIDRIRHIKVRLAYEAGREQVVKDFVVKTALIEGLDEIKGDKANFIRYSKYLEALVAYHRFYGGKDE